MITYYDLEKALKNPTSPRELVIFLDKEDFSLLEQLDRFVNLKKLSLLDSEELTQLPPAVLKLNQLELLRLRATGIRTLPEEIGALSNLKELNIENTPLETLPENIGQLRQLNLIDTKKTKLRSLPPSIGNLKQLNILYLKDACLERLPDTIGLLESLKLLDLSSEYLEELPSTIGDLKKLEGLYLKDSQVTTLPTSLINLTEIRYLYLNNNKLSFLPKGIRALHQLTHLELDNNDFKEFPIEICDCKLLANFSIRGNQLEELPEDLAKLKKLNRAAFTNNKFKQLPYILLDFGNTFALNHRWGFSIEPSLFNNAPLFELLNKKAFQQLSRAEKIDYFKLFIKDDKQMETLPHTTIRKALNAKVSVVADNALDYLTKGAADSLKIGSELLILGKTTRAKSDLLTQIEACGLKTTTKIKDSTTHILVSARGNKKLEKLPEEVHWHWITEAQLIHYMDKVQPSFLLETASVEMIKQVVHLILTLEEENMSLALELITGGGLPPELITEVFIVYKLSEVAETRKKAQKLLKQKAATELQQVLRMRTNIRHNKSYYFDEDYRALYEKLHSYTETTAIDLGKLAFAVAMKSRLGYALALDNAPAELRRRLLKEVLAEEGTVFDLPYHERLKKFPLELTEFPALKKINIDMERGIWSREGGWIPNKLFKIPTEIAKLQHLEDLQIGSGILQELPIEALCQLKNLKRILLRAAKTIDIGPIKKALPNCEVKIRVD